MVARDDAHVGAGTVVTRGVERSSRRRRSASHIAQTAALSPEQRAFRRAKAPVLDAALPYAEWRRTGFHTNRKPVARRILADGTEEKWYRADEVFRREVAKKS
jgi:hypothetical protein